MAYDKPIYQTFTANANASVSTAADVFQISGPVGKTGRVVAVSLATSTATTVAASALELGTQADADALGSIAVPITAINLGIQIGQTALDTISDLAADTVYTLRGNGAASAGALDIAVTVAWF